MLVFILLISIFMPRPIPSPRVAPTEVLIRFQPQFPVCEHVTVPEALNTPLPLLPEHSYGVVDFIVGQDGRVYNPIFLKTSMDKGHNLYVLKAVNAWRFRPAMCDDIPMQTEGRTLVLRR